MNWIQSLNEAITYMEEHLLEDISCEEIAEHVYFSSYHFHRMFRLLTGITVKDYIRNRRLSLAGEELVLSEEKVLDVALKYGYETPESFAKAFYRFHGITPKQAKKEGSCLKAYPRLVIKIILEGGSLMDYKMVQRDAFTIATKVKWFKPETSTKDIPTFWREYFAQGLGDIVCGMIGICLEENKETREFRYGIGCEWEEGKEIPDGFEAIIVPANTWACFTCVGAMPNAIQDMWKRVYSEWLPQSGYEIVPNYDMEVYTEGEVSSSDYISQIWIPVRKNY